MRLSRVPSGLVVPALLVGLVALLGTLQYRWLGKVSEAEREQLRQSVERRAHEFADDFDGEIGRLYTSLQNAWPAADASSASLSAAVERWQAAARFPRLLRSLSLAEQRGDRWTLRPYDLQLRAFGPATEAWPASLEKIREQLPGTNISQTIGPGGRSQVVAISVAPVVSGVPALVIPVPRGFLPPLPGAPVPPMHTVEDRFFVRWAGTYLVAELDDQYLRRHVVPSLVARHFPEEGSAAYRVGVLSDADRTVFTRGFQAGAAVDPQTADAVVPFFNLRLDILRSSLVPALGESGKTVRDEGAGKELPTARGQHLAVFVERRADESGKAGEGTRLEGRIRIMHPSWKLVVRHPAGSLDRAVSQARQRNLWVSFGILGVLAAGVVLVVNTARKASRLAAREVDFVATVSHELRTPIAVIRSAAQNLSAGVVSDPAQARRYGELIEDQGRRLTDTVEQVLEYAGLRGNARLRRREPIDLQALLEELAVGWRPLCAQAGATLDLQPCRPDLPTVTGDEALLRRALDNLVTNAVKHAADGGWVGVETALENSRGRRAVRLTVSDRGRGIAAADLPHIFEPFFRGSQAMERQVPGNGLGLSLVKRVAEAHGGSVSVRSAAAEGTRFTLRLPAGSLAGEPDEGVEPAAPLEAGE
jgi:signal transduction histidine kinase